MKIKVLVNQLDSLQQNWAENIEEIKSIVTCVDQLREHEKMYWLQRSRVKWLKEGDANTAFFHCTTLQLRRINKVAKTKEEYGL